MVIASYIWMKWYALLQFTASASYFIQQPFISFPAELFRNKFRHLINSWSDSGRNTRKKKKPSLCRFTLFKIIFHNKGAIGGALSQQRGRYSFCWDRCWFEDKLSVSLVQRNGEKDRKGGGSDHGSAESLEPGCAGGGNKFVLLSGFKKLQL